MKKFCKSEQRELDAMCHTSSVMCLPFRDLRDGYGCSIDQQIWWKVCASTAKRPVQVDPFQNHFQYACGIHRYNRYASPRKFA